MSELNTYLSEIASVIKEKRGLKETDKLNAQDFAEEISKISGDEPEEDLTPYIQFYDIDGSLITKLTIEDALALEAVPEPIIERNHLVFTGYGVDLERIKEDINTFQHNLKYVACYDTIDGSTIIELDLPVITSNISLGIAVEGTIEIDWGDGSSIQTKTGTSLASMSPMTHTYNEVGSYLVKVNTLNDSLVRLIAHTIEYGKNIKGLHLNKNTIIYENGLQWVINLNYITFNSDVTKIYDAALLADYSNMTASHICLKNNLKVINFNQIVEFDNTYDANKELLHYCFGQEKTPIEIYNFPKWTQLVANSYNFLGAFKNTYFYFAEIENNEKYDLFDFWHPYKNWKNTSFVCPKLKYLNSNDYEGTYYKWKTLFSDSKMEKIIFPSLVFNWQDNTPELVNDILEIKEDEVDYSNNLWTLGNEAIHSTLKSNNCIKLCVGTESSISKSHCSLDMSELKELSSISINNPEYSWRQSLINQYQYRTFNAPKLEDIEYFSFEKESFKLSFDEKYLVLNIPNLKRIGKYGLTNTCYKDIDLRNVESIDEYGLTGNILIRSYNLSSLKTINKYAFSSNTRLEKLYLPNVETIDQYAFQYCYNLKYVKLGSLISSLQGMLFQHCPNLKILDLTAATTPPTVSGSNVFSGSNFYTNLNSKSFCYIVVPDESLDLYKKWKNINSNILSHIISKSDYENQFGPLPEYN